MDENARRLKQFGAEVRSQLYGKPPAKPAVRQSPIKPQMSEIERQSRANLTAKFALFDQINAICREFNEPDLGIACEMTEAGLTVDEARRELAQRAAVRSWAGPLGANSPMH